MRSYAYVLRGLHAAFPQSASRLHLSRVARYPERVNPDAIDPHPNASAADTAQSHNPIGCYREGSTATPETPRPETIRPIETATPGRLALLSLYHCRRSPAGGAGTFQL